ncbi:MAG: hypothetical protein IKE28_00270 [Solobacterium sp.]|nr:hypothetical protein [Solobacterium sp.]
MGKRRGSATGNTLITITRMRTAYLVFSVFMMVLFGLGIRSFFVVPPQAKKEAAEIEEMLRKQQEEEEERKRQLQEELARKAAEEEARRKEEEELAKNPLRGMYNDASEMVVVGIGDSVMLGALDALYAEFPNGYFDAVFGRTIYDGKRVCASMSENNTLGDVVVFSLGANSYIEEEDVEELIGYCGDRPTFWLTTVGVTNDSNEKTRNVVARHEKAYMVDWETVAKEHYRSYILADGLHPTAEGAAAYAQLIHDEINADVLAKPKETEE